MVGCNSQLKFTVKSVEPNRVVASDGGKKHVMNTTVWQKTKLPHEVMDCNGLSESLIYTTISQNYNAYSTKEKIILWLFCLQF